MNAFDSIPTLRPLHALTCPAMHAPSMMQMTMQMPGPGGALSA